MKKYTFFVRGLDKNHTVQAPNESEARSLCMHQCYPPIPDNIIPYSKYRGDGLDLVSVE